MIRVILRLEVSQKTFCRIIIICRTFRAQAPIYLLIAALTINPTAVSPAQSGVSLFAFSFSQAARWCRWAPQGAIKCLLRDREFPSANRPAARPGCRNFYPRRRERSFAEK